VAVAEIVVANPAIVGDTLIDDLRASQTFRFAEEEENC
jgi:hypothetical protein